MTIEQKIKEIEGFVDKIATSFECGEDSCTAVKLYYSSFRLLQEALEVIRELQAKLNANDYLNNSHQNIKNISALQDTLIEKLEKENAAFKAQVDRVGDTEKLALIMSGSPEYVEKFLNDAKELQNYILGGEGV